MMIPSLLQAPWDQTLPGDILQSEENKQTKKKQETVYAWPPQLDKVLVSAIQHVKPNKHRRQEGHLLTQRAITVLKLQSD